MGSVAVPSSSAAPPTDPQEPPDPERPELSEAGYLKEVLHVTAQLSEAEVVDELLAKASALGIAASSRPSTAGKQHISSAESATTDNTRHARTLSTDSDGSASTALTSHSSVKRLSAMDATGPSAKRSSKVLSFSQYDKYLNRLEPNLKQPKMPKAAPESEPAPSIFSVSTRKSYATLKRTIKGKVPWRKKPTVTMSDFPR
jgi:hypothetical protein